MKNIVLILVSLIMSSVVLASEKSLYKFSWLDSDKEIYVLQNRKFRKVGTPYIGATAAYNLDQAFLNGYGGTIRGGYFFSEDWGVEFLYGKFSYSENDTAQGVRDQGTYPFSRRIDSYMGGMLMWAPFYSKINTFNKIFYYDWMFGVGVGSITTKDNRKEFEAFPSKDLTEENSIGGLWNTGLRFYMNTNWSLRIDVTGQVYNASKTSKVDGTSEVKKSTSLFSSYDIGLGINYAF